MSRNNKYQNNQRGKGATLASQADRYVLYEKAVQCVEAEIDMVDETFLSLRGRTAQILREDFCGTANTSCEWVRRRDTNQAYAVDLDKKVIRWGKKHNISKLNGDAAGRIHLLNDNVLTVDVPPADTVLAMNFSYQIFKTRPSFATTLAGFTQLWLMMAYFSWMHSAVTKPIGKWKKRPNMMTSLTFGTSLDTTL